MYKGCDFILTRSVVNNDQHALRADLKLALKMTKFNDATCYMLHVSTIKITYAKHAALHNMLTHRQ